MRLQRGIETIHRCDPDRREPVIGVFDSGLGGLYVLSEIRRAIPPADLLYVADRARAPYGLRSLDEVREMSHEVADWLIGRGVDTVVVACNTASAAALDSLRSRFHHVSFVGMEPAVKPAAGNTRTGVIGVLATAATFQGELFRSVVDRHAGTSRVIERACPRWVDFVEQGETSGRTVEQVVRSDIESLIEQGADMLVIGCTHFSFLKPVIRAVAGEAIEIVDPASAVAAQTARVAGDQRGSGTTTWASSGDRGEFARLARSVAGIKTGRPVLPFP